MARERAASPMVRGRQAWPRKPYPGRMLPLCPRVRCRNAGRRDGGSTRAGCNSGIVGRRWRDGRSSSHLACSRPRPALWSSHALQKKRNVRGEDAAISMKEGHGRDLHLARAGPLEHLVIGFDEVRHSAPDATMLVAEKPAVGVERHLAVAAEPALARQRTRPAAGRETTLLQEDRERDREAVVNGGVADVGDRDAGDGARALNA